MNISSSITPVISTTITTTVTTIAYTTISEDSIYWPPKMTLLPGNTRSALMRALLLNFPSYSLRVSMVLLLVLATLVLYHMLNHVLKLIMDVRRMAMELSQASVKLNTMRPESHAMMGKPDSPVDRPPSRTGPSEIELP
ncbi:unnamed protein product [Lymnaea stagnalis]|uniref:Uncharacterized protein n=1 Tax=Lymnaea stagnalis TaxID=6523 RepID=A0AAV2I1N1_LYMST